MILALLFVMAALSQDGEPADVRETLAGSDVVVNWTTLSLEVSATGVGGATESIKAVEELAQRDADAGIRQGVARVRVGVDRMVAQLQEVPEFGPALEARISRWEAVETRYHSSGKVEVDAELSLIDLLKPYTLARAKQPGAGDGPQARYTGLVVDARGTDALPAWSPRLLASNGEVLWDGTVWEDVAIASAPAVFVSDPAHPASARAGEDPLFLRVDGANGPELTLTPEDSQRFRTSLGGTARILGEGTVVVVVDPP